MATHKHDAAQNVEVEDATAAFRNLENLARRVLSAPKTGKPAKAKSAKRTKRH